MINYILLVNAQGIVRTARYYKHVASEDRKQLETSVIKTCLSRIKQQSTILDYEDYTMVYRKFGTVILIAGVTTDEHSAGDFVITYANSLDPDETSSNSVYHQNELAVMELFQLFLETLNKLLGKITEVHILYNLDKVYMVLDEMVINGRIAETCQDRILAPLQLMTMAK